MIELGISVAKEMGTDYFTMREKQATHVLALAVMLLEKCERLEREQKIKYGKSK